MTGNVLKAIAMFSMLVDHVGAIFFPDIVVFRVIGRLAFPVFAFLAAEGCYYTHDIFKYFLRLCAFGVVSQVPYCLAFGFPSDIFPGFNIFFTLAFAVLSVGFFQQIPFAPQRSAPAVFLVVILVLILSASLLHFDYGAYGVVLVLAFYMSRLSRKKAFGSFAGLTVLQSISTPMQLSSLLACIPLSKYNGRRGKPIPKWLFYSFYPAHLAFLVILRLFFMV